MTREKLDDFLLYFFIPDNVKINKKRHPVIHLKKICELGLSSEELNYAIEFIEREGIIISGLNPENLDYIMPAQSEHLEKSLSNEEEIQLFLEYRTNKSIELRNKLIKHNLRLAIFIAWRFARVYNLDARELEGYAYEGLIYAIERFDPNLGNKFSVFAYLCVNGFIHKSLSENSNLPVYLFSIFNKCRRIVENRLNEQYIDSEEMLEEIVREMINQGAIPACYFEDYKIFLKKYLSLEELRENDVQIADIDFTEEIIKNESVRAMMEQVSLSPTELRIINLRYGFENGKVYSLEEVGQIFGVTRERIRQIEARVLRKFRIYIKVTRIKENRVAKYKTIVRYL